MLRGDEAEKDLEGDDQENEDVDKQTDESLEEVVDEFEDVCIVCGHAKKQHKNKRETLHCTTKIETIEKFQNEAEIIEDFELWTALQNAKKLEEDHSIFYHTSCRNMINSSCRNVTRSRKNPTIWHKKRQIASNVYARVCDYIVENVIEGNKCILLNFCHTLYSTFLKNLYEKDLNLLEFQPSRPRYLEAELRKTFKNDIGIVTMNKKKLLSQKEQQ